MIAVTLITQAGCHLCDDAYEKLQALASEYPIEVAIVNLDSPEGRTAAARAGMAFPPAVLLDDRPFSYGRLSVRRLRRELDARLHPASQE